VAISRQNPFSTSMAYLTFALARFLVIFNSGKVKKLFVSSRSERE